MNHDENENDGNDGITFGYWLVQWRRNLTACDTFNEETFEGPTQETQDSYVFFDEAEAMKFYTERKAMLKFAGTPMDYYTYPTKHALPNLLAKSSVVIDCETFDNVHYTIRCRSTKEVCERCRGEGSHVNPNIDGHGLSQEDFDEDPDFKENYMSGVYDVQCEECKGLRVVDVPDIESLPKELQEDYWRREQADRDSDAEVEAERRYFARFER
jgi:hypothetical protein